MQLTFATVMKSLVMLSFWLLPPSLNPWSSPPTSGLTAPTPIPRALRGARGRGVAQGGDWSPLCPSVEGLACSRTQGSSLRLGLLPGSWGCRWSGMAGGKLRFGCARMCLSSGH